MSWFFEAVVSCASEGSGIGPDWGYAGRLTCQVHPAPSVWRTVWELDDKSTETYSSLRIPRNRVQRGTRAGVDQHSSVQKMS
jgi:hypothetical protein